MGIYLDNHVATKPFSASIERMHALYKERWGDMTAPHLKGQEVLSLSNTSLSVIYDFLGAGEKDLFTFASSGGEALSRVFSGLYADFVRESGRNHFLTTSIEENSTYQCLERLDQFGCIHKKIPVSSGGQLTKEILEESMRPRTALVSISWANPITGVIQPVYDLAQVCKEKGARFHVEASGVLGKLFFRFQDANIDYLTFDGSLVHAPKGSGGLLQKEGSFVPQLGSSSWDTPAPLLTALATSFTELQANFDHICLETARLRDRLEKGIIQGYPEAISFFTKVERLPNTAVIAFPGVFHEALLYALHRKGVYASMGGGRYQKVSEVLKACGVSPEIASTALHFSLSHETTQKQIDDAVQIIVESAKLLRKSSQKLWTENHG